MSKCVALGAGLLSLVMSCTPRGSGPVSDGGNGAASSCSLCVADYDCLQQSEACAQTTSGSECLAPCQTNQDCSPVEVCTPFTTVEGNSFQACLATNGSCGSALNSSPNDGGVNAHTGGDQDAGDQNTTWTPGIRTPVRTPEIRTTFRTPGTAATLRTPGTTTLTTPGSSRHRTRASPAPSPRAVAPSRSSISPSSGTRDPRTGVTPAPAPTLPRSSTRSTRTFKG